MAEELAGDAMRAPEEESCADRAAIATFIERYAERLVKGPAVKEFAHPINRNRYTAEEGAAVRSAIYSLAQAVRTGVDQAEHDWPLPLFAIGDVVEKKKGSAWHGRIVGFYSTDLTPEGYAVESEREPGSVQIYPAAALQPYHEPRSEAHFPVML